VDYAEIYNINKKYGNKSVIKEFKLNIHEGEIVAVVGPSGCGKTTLLQIIAGLVKADTGSVCLDGKTLFSTEKNVFVPPEKRRIAMVFQNYALWPHYNVYQNLSYPLRVRRINKRDIEKSVTEVIEMVQLKGMQKRYPHELSGGEQQRVALARALVIKPELLLLDESLSNLDAKLKEEMLVEIKKIQKNWD
jgi:iron(III) transport system ATP-binding protein